MSAETPPLAEEVPPLFEVRLGPHRSLSERGFAILTWALLAFGFAHGILFLVIGAWPVVGFAGAEWLLFWWLLRRHLKGDRTSERLRLFPGSLALERSDAKGSVTRLELQPYWLRVELDPRPAMGNALFLSSHGQRHELGRFLSTGERAALADTLRAELARCRAAG